MLPHGPARNGPLNGTVKLAVQDDAGRALADRVMNTDNGTGDAGSRLASGELENSGPGLLHAAGCPVARRRPRAARRGPRVYDGG